MVFQRKSRKLRKSKKSRKSRRNKRGGDHRNGDWWAGYNKGHHDCQSWRGYDVWRDYEDRYNRHDWSFGYQIGYSACQDAR
jgi:hypothetical protein